MGRIDPRAAGASAAGNMDSLDAGQAAEDARAREAIGGRDQSASAAPARYGRGRVSRPAGAELGAESTAESDADAVADTESHTLSVGVGATAGALSGAALGAAGGPIGMAVGALLGGAAGGLLGRGVGEAINPRGEREYWARQYRGRDYVRDGDPFDLYLPAYCFGWETWPRFAAAEMTFAQAESDLESEWAAGPGQRHFGWPRARCAVRDAWERLDERSIREATTPLLRLAQMNIASADAIVDARDRAALKVRGVYDRMCNERLDAADELATLAGRSIDELHAAASESVVHEIREGWIEIKTLVRENPAAFCQECIRSLEHLRSVYMDVLRRNMAAVLRTVLRRQLDRLGSAIDSLRAATPG